MSFNWLNQLPMTFEFEVNDCSHTLRDSSLVEIDSNLTKVLKHVDLILCFRSRLYCCGISIFNQPVVVGSADGGREWLMVSSLPFIITDNAAIAACNTSLVYLLQHDKQLDLTAIWVSDDALVSWHLVSSSSVPLTSEHASVSLHASADGQLVVEAERDGLRERSISVDGGVSWSRMERTTDTLWEHGHPSDGLLMTAHGAVAVGVTGRVFVSLSSVVSYQSNCLVDLLSRKWLPSDLIIDKILPLIIPHQMR